MQAPLLHSDTQPWDLPPASLALKVGYISPATGLTGCSRAMLRSYSTLSCTVHSLHGYDCNPIGKAGRALCCHYDFYMLAGWLRSTRCHILLHPTVFQAQAWAGISSQLPPPVRWTGSLDKPGAPTRQFHHLIGESSTSSEAPSLAEAPQLGLCTPECRAGLMRRLPAGRCPGCPAAPGGRAASPAPPWLRAGTCTSH